MVLGVGERRRGNHRRYRKWGVEGATGDDRSLGWKQQQQQQEEAGPDPGPVGSAGGDPASDNNHRSGGGGSDDTMPLLFPLRSRRSRSKAGTESERSAGKKRKKSILGALSLRRIGNGGGGGGADDCIHSDDDDDCCCSDTSSSAPPSPGRLRNLDGGDANAEAEAAVLRGKMNADDHDDDDDWTEASAAAMSSVAALAAAVRRGVRSDAEAESAEARRKALMSPPCSPMAPSREEEEVEEEDDEEENDKAEEAPPPPSLPLVWEDISDEKGETIEGNIPNKELCEEEEKKEEDQQPQVVASTPPLLPPPPPSMPSPQRRKFMAASRPGGGVTFADDHSSVDAALVDVRKVSRLPDECYGGCCPGQHRGEGSVLLRDDRRSGDALLGGEGGGVVVVLLLCPSTKQFEMVRVSLPPPSSSPSSSGTSSSSSSSSPTCGEILGFARRRARFRPLRKQRYTGLCKLPPSVWQQERTEEEEEGNNGGNGGCDVQADVAGAQVAAKKKSGEEEEAPPSPPPSPPPASPPREMINALRIETYGIGRGEGNEGDGGRDDDGAAVGGDVLVAIPKGLTASEATKHARPILSDEKMRRIMRERLSSATEVPSAEARTKGERKTGRRSHKRHRKDGEHSRKERARSKEIAIAREFSSLSPPKVPRTRLAVKSLLMAALAVGIILSSAAFLWLHWTKRADLLSEARTYFWPAAVLLPATAPLAPTPGYGKDNAGLLEECCPA